MLLVFARRIHTLFERQIFYAMLVVNSVCTCAATVWIKKNSLVKDDPHDLVGASMHLLSDVKTLTKLIDIGEVKVKGKILGVDHELAMALTLLADTETIQVSGPEAVINELNLR